MNTKNRSRSLVALLSVGFVSVLFLATSDADQSSVDKYEAPSDPNTSCKFFHWTPYKLSKVGDFDLLAKAMSAKAHVSEVRWKMENNKVNAWLDFIFDQSEYQRKPVAAPTIISGTLRPHRLTAAQLEKNFGKEHRANMEFTSLLGGPVTVRFPSFKGKLPCGEVNIAFKKWESKAGVLVIYDPLITPSKSGQ